MQMFVFGITHEHAGFHLLLSKSIVVVLSLTSNCGRFQFPGLSFLLFWLTLFIKATTKFSLLSQLGSSSSQDNKHGTVPW